MDTSSHSMQTLFQQLGIPNSDAAIEAFFHNNHLPGQVPIERAAFWNAGQAQFIQEAIADDSDWSEIVDQMDALLRH